MRIALDITSLAKPRRTGIATYGLNLIRGLKSVAPEHCYTGFLRPHRVRRFGLVRELLPDLPIRILVDPLASELLRRQDLLHALGARLPPTSYCPRLATIHDVHVFEQPELASASRRRKRRARLLQTADRASAIIALSRQGASAIERHLQVAPARVHVVAQGVDLARFTRSSVAPTDDILSELKLGSRPYVLSVGPLGARKNQSGLIQAFARAALPAEWMLVLAGSGPGQPQMLATEARRAQLDPSRVRWLGWLKPPTYDALMSRSRVYACPSRHEGFGLPILEALASRVPVVASNRAAIPETIGPGGLCVDPENVTELAAALRLMALSDLARSEVRRKGLAWVRSGFSWKRTARETLCIYRALIERHRQVRSRRRPPGRWTEP